jgi:hypothetical protein
MDVVTVYLYGSLDSNIYIKVSERLKVRETNDTCPKTMFSIKLQRLLYRLKQSGCMWYNRFNKYLLNESYKNDDICPYIFIKKTNIGFAIVTVYVDNLNLIGTSEEFNKTANYLKNEFEMKDLEKIEFCLEFQIEYFP